jgi:hypothetical protein
MSGLVIPVAVSAGKKYFGNTSTLDVPLVPKDGVFFARQAA